jgi:hypothetical protein
MMNAINVQKGGLHVEIVPADQSGCVRGEIITDPTGVSGLGRCTGAHVRYPKKGERIRVVGAYVFDPENQWYEIHPAWSIKLLKHGS